MDRAKLLIIEVVNQYLNYPLKAKTECLRFSIVGNQLIEGSPVRARLHLSRNSSCYWLLFFNFWTNSSAFGKSK